MNLQQDLEKVLITHEEIVEISKRMGKEIERDYREKNPLLIGLLKGCIPFIAELMLHIDTHVELDFMDVSSYYGGTKSTDSVRVLKDLGSSVKGRDVLIIEDIVDSGKTIQLVKEMLSSRGATTVGVATLLDKPSGRKVELEPEYIGTVIPDGFVVGYGLDYEENYRNLDCIGILKKEIYTKRDGE